MTSFEWKKKWIKVQDWWATLWMACKLPDHVLFQIYDRAAGGISCHCCVFYRGVLFGIFWQCILIVIAALIGRQYVS